jgi:predicted transcriptional regulator
MSDLRTEIVTKVLNGWDTTNTQAKESLTESIFTYVQNNPSCTANDVVDSTRADLGRASAILLSLYQKGKLDRKEYPNPNPDGKRHSVYVYWTAVDNFKDKAVSRIAKKSKKVKLSVEKATLRLRDTFAMPRMKQFAHEPTPSKFEPEKFVKGLSLTEVKQLHKFLESYFE